MRIGIIGAGFAGLSCAYSLVKKGFNVTILEKAENPGGLATGFKDKKWDWTLENHFHHCFVSDWEFRNLAEEIGVKMIFKKVKTSTYIKGHIYEFDSPFSLLSFSEISFSDRIRTGMVLAYLRYLANWKSLENISAKDFLSHYMGKKSWEILWRPLFEKKFGDYADKISASWFWARIKKRSVSLGYPEGGYLSFAKKMSEEVKKRKGRVIYKTQVNRIERKKDVFSVYTNRGVATFDKVVFTLPTNYLLKILTGLPRDYVSKIITLNGLGAINLILSLNKSFLEDGTYWLGINDTRFPFVAIVEHTNFMDKRHYNNENLLYIGNYLSPEHKYFKSEAIDLLREFYPYLKTINPKFNENWINNLYLSKSLFAQPVITLNYSQMLLDFKTPIGGLYLCNIQQVYPWDRGTNYAIELGKKVADFVLFD